MDTPDFKRIAEVTAPYLKKDSRHTLIIFTVSGLAVFIWAWFNTEYSIELLSVGVFLLILGIVRYFFEQSKRPYLSVARIKKKVAIPYTRIEGTYDYFIDIEPVANYSFALDGKFDKLPTEPEQRLKISPDIFKALQENGQVMILLSATKVLVGVLDDDYRFTSYL
jgi:hypothetical protein